MKHDIYREIDSYVWIKYFVFPSGSTYYIFHIGRFLFEKRSFRSLCYISISHPVSFEALAGVCLHTSTLLHCHAFKSNKENCTASLGCPNALEMLFNQSIRIECNLKYTYAIHVNWNVYYFINNHTQTILFCTLP